MPTRSEKILNAIKLELLRPEGDPEKIASENINVWHGMNEGTFYLKMPFSINTFGDAIGWKSTEDISDGKRKLHDPLKRVDLGLKAITLNKHYQNPKEPSVLFYLKHSEEELKEFLNEKAQGKKMTCEVAGDLMHYDADRNRVFFETPLPPPLPDLSDPDAFFARTFQGAVAHVDTAAAASIAASSSGAAASAATPDLDISSIDPGRASPDDFYKQVQNTPNAKLTPEFLLMTGSVSESEFLRTKERLAAKKPQETRPWGEAVGGSGRKRPGALLSGDDGTSKARRYESHLDQVKPPQQNAR